MNDLERKRQAAKLKELSRFVSKNKRIRVASKSNAVARNATTAPADPTASQQQQQSKHEVIAKLRKLGQAATLFGESEEDRASRLAEAEKKHHKVVGGQRNEFLKILKSANASAALSGDKYLLGLKTLPENPSDEERILSWLARMLLEWQAELQARSESEKQTPQGKVATGRYVQTRQEVEPLFQKLQSRAVDSNLKRMIKEIVENCELRQYKAAHEKYVDLSIGNAAWPIGVTMVGIHERAGRSRIFTSEISHILNDETTRKCIHALKRLLSFSQRKWPADPSQMVIISTEHV